MPMANHDCAVHGCGNMVAVALVICWPCLSRLPQERRKALEAARNALNHGCPTAALDHYRAVRTAVVAEAQVEFLGGRRRVA